MQNHLFGRCCRNRDIYINNIFGEAKGVLGGKAANRVKANMARAVALRPLVVLVIFSLMNCFVRVASSQSSYKHIPL